MEYKAKVLGFDLETTSLEVPKARIIEIGAIIFGVDEGNIWHPLENLSQLVWNIGDEPIPQEASDVNGITDAMLAAKGIPLIEAMQKLGALADGIDYIIAHNSNYDRAVFNSVLDRNELCRFVTGIQRLAELPWLCSMQDLRSNLKFHHKALSCLALNYKVPVDPNVLHRAVADVELMGKMLTGAGADPHELFKYQQMPSFFVAVEIPPPWKDDGKGKKAVSQLGFSWQVARGTEGPEFEKCWVKLVKESDYEELQTKCNYRMKVLRPL